MEIQQRHETGVLLGIPLVMEVKNYLRPSDRWQSLIGWEVSKRGRASFPAGPARRNQFLAGAQLALNQNRGVGGRGGADNRADLAQFYYKHFLDARSGVVV
jgi:hypothetical protein